MVTATKQEYGFQFAVDRISLYDGLLDRCPTCGTQKPAQALCDTVFGPLRTRALQVGVTGEEFLALERDGRWYRATFWFFGSPEQGAAFNALLDGMTLAELQAGVEFRQAVEFLDMRHPNWSLDTSYSGTFAAEMRDALLSLRGAHRG